MLAAPKGTAYQFRYDDSYVDASVRGRNLVGMPALVHFAIQQEAQYHAPAFIPVRLGKVISAETRAGIFVVNFEISDYVSIKRPAETALSGAVSDYTAALATHSVSRPYGISVSVGIDLRSVDSTPLEAAVDESRAFRSTTELLQRTSWFRDARFVRFLGFRDGDATVALKNRLFNLAAGKTYELELTHYTPSDVTGRDPFSVDADGDVVRVIGRPGFDDESVRTWREG